MLRDCLTATLTVIILLGVYSTILQVNWTRGVDILESAKAFLNNRYTIVRNEQAAESFRCTKTFKEKHFMFLDFKPGRTGNAFFQVCCLLAISARNCYTPILHRRNKIFMQSFEPLYDLKNIEMPDQAIDNNTFRVMPAGFVSQRRKFGLKEHYNWTLRHRCSGNTFIEDEEEFVRSSIRLKRHYVREAGEYIRTSFPNRSTVAIHVRRTDRINLDQYEYQDFKWYKQYITQAMEYIKVNYTDLSFIFISDDIAWCYENFHGPHIHYSDGDSVGFDLALLELCDHVILTMGTFGRNGAWLGEHKSVIYSKHFVVPRFYTNDFFLKSWTGI